MTEYIQVMPKPPTNYFRYLPVSRVSLSWGIAVSAAGRTHVVAGSRYPAGRHPDDHALDWQRGRILETLQIVLITAGRGILETGASKPQAIEAGAAFMLFPKTWHRYRPDESTGWDESWLELTGATVDRLLRERAFVPTQPFLPPAEAVGLERALDAVHAQVQTSHSSLDPELAARGFAVLAAWKSGADTPRRQTRLHQAVELAERHLSDHASEPVNIAALARRLGVAYSHFRHAFQLHTGYAPWRYVTHLRLTQGKRMLVGSDATLEKIAAHLGFSSSFHFSSAFKRTFGLSPKAWRKSIVRESKPQTRSR